MQSGSGKKHSLPSKTKNELLRDTHLKTPLSNMQTFTGLMTAYWRSDKRGQAWASTLGIGALIAATSQSNVWMAQYAGEFIDTLSKLPYTDSQSPVLDVLKLGAAIMGVSMAQHLALLPGKKYLLENLHRKWRGWLNGQFNEAIMDDRNTYLHLTHGVSTKEPDYIPMPTNIDQRWQDSIKSMTGGALGLAHGLVTVATSSVLITLAMLETTAKVDGLEFLGEYGTLALTFGAAAVYVPANTYVAWKIGKYLEKVTNRIEETEGSYRGELNAMFRLGLHIAASGAAKVQSKINKALYKDVDDAWKKLIVAHTGYSAFHGLYNGVSSRIVAYLPALPAYVQGNMGFKSFMTGSELFTSFINDCSWLINVMPAVSGLKAQWRRVSDVVNAVERVAHSKEFYSETGVSNYAFDEQDPAFGLRVKNLSLRHQGHDAKPFLQASNLRFRPGQWTYVEGPSGSGKSSLMRAINGLLPYGEGTIVLPKDKKEFYACQEVRLPRTSLKQLVSIPDEEENHSDAQVIQVLKAVGLEKFVPDLHNRSCDGDDWEGVLSGGQKQLLVLARGLLQRADIWYLDEAFSALDPQSKIRGHELIREYCPQAIVISVMHDPAPPVNTAGMPFYDTILEIKDGRAKMRNAMLTNKSEAIIGPLPRSMEPILI